VSLGSQCGGDFQGAALNAAIVERGQ
jgi:hypothetical protein